MDQKLLVPVFSTHTWSSCQFMYSNLDWEWCNTTSHHSCPGREDPTYDM